MGIPIRTVNFWSLFGIWVQLHAIGERERRSALASAGRLRYVYLTSFDWRKKRRTCQLHREDAPGYYSLCTQLLYRHRETVWTWPWSRPCGSGTTSLTGEGAMYPPDSDFCLFSGWDEFGSKENLCTGYLGCSQWMREGKPQTEHFPQDTLQRSTHKGTSWYKRCQTDHWRASGILPTPKIRADSMLFDFEL